MDRLQELELTIPTSDPREFFGANNKKFKQLAGFFPKLKIMARGDVIKVLGSPELIDEFQLKLDAIFQHLEKYSHITEDELEKILNNTAPALGKVGSSEILVFGPGGNKVKARTKNQQLMVKACDENDMVFAIGPAGTGKTYTAVALAVRALKEKQVKRIILTRPAVEAGENLGFLPGDLKEKLDPYMQPLYDALMDMIHYEKLADYVDKGMIEIAPLAFMRGRTLDKAFVILDEAQNSTVPQIKMFLTRMGKDAKFIITGDSTQVDLPPKQASGLLKAVELLEGTKGIAFIHLDETDVIRHKLVKRIISAFEKSST